ncbi:SCO family protein (plasmid) [Skermanella mucosa]|uniref:SCO family protein n=1 Tax=Skermanella mucosa TaxID=1789672 RepID=UPI00192BD56F|nr:SCO family protein [Skermanella mucosa]UEM25271.1 SCO family protein [Skermanella mucosa]
MNPSRRSLLWGAAAVAGAGLAGALGLGGGFADPAEAFDGSPDGVFPNVVLQGDDGRSYRFYDDLIRDRIVMVNLFFTGCGDVCPLSTQNLVQVQEKLADRVGRDIFMYSITLNPDLDSEAVLRDYKEIYGVGPGWLFLRGSRDDTELLRRQLGFVDPDPELDADLETHIGVVKIGNDAIGRWAACPAFSDPEEIIRVVGSVEPLTRRG